VNQLQKCECGASLPSHTRTPAQVRNDARVLAFAKNRVQELEQELKNTRAELALLRSKPSFATQREKYVLGEMDIVNRQLDCKFTTSSFFPNFCIFLRLCLGPIILAFCRFCA
jgi:hypothetical protein